MDPELRAAGVLLRLLLPAFHKPAFRLSNRALSLGKGRRARGMRCGEVFIPRPSGSAARGPLRLRVYRPLEEGAARPGILWLHGGGYALGIPEQDEGFIRGFVHGRGCAVVAPDYCLSLRAPYPAALEDAYLALEWLRDNATALNVRPDQLMAGGDSSGGGLCAALAVHARDRGGPVLAFQMPLYPMLDDRMATPSARDNDAPVWNTRSNRNAWKLYLGALYGTEAVPPAAAPGRLKDFSGLPPAFTYVGSLEPFRDEALAYVEGLKAAGVPAECAVFQGCFHGFDILLPRSTPARRARALLMERFDYAAAQYFARQPERPAEQRDRRRES